MANSPHSKDWGELAIPLQKQKIFRFSVLKLGIAKYTPLTQQYTPCSRSYAVYSGFSDLWNTGQKA